MSKITLVGAFNKHFLEFVDEIKKCDVILSSSLHGIICGDAYGIPSYWIELSDKVIGNGFKFLDYFLSVKRKEKGPIVIEEKTKIEEICSCKFNDYKIDIDLDLLYNACPFRRN